MRNKVISLTLTFLLLFTLCSCSKDKSSNSGNLTIYTVEHETWWTEAAEEFEENNKNAKVNIVSFKTIEELETRMSSEIMSGEGPDLVFWSYFNYNSTLDMRRMAESGYFIDLNEYLEKDDSFNRANYYESVLDCGKINGSQYSIPLWFSVPFVLANETAMDNSGLADKEKITMKDFLAAVDSEFDRLGEDGDKAGLGRVQYAGILGHVLYSGLVDIDFANKTVTSDKEKVHELIDFYPMMKKSCAYYETPAEERSKMTDNVSFIYDDTFPAVDLSIFFLNQYRANGEKPVFFSFTDYDDESGYNARSMLEIAINKNSKNPDLAYRFIRSVMDSNALTCGQIQYSYNGAKKTVNAVPFSVNRAKNELYLGSYLVGTGLPFMEDEYVDYFYPEMIEVFDNMNACYYWSWNVGNTINESFETYLNGSEDFDTCYDRMMNELTLYITE